jgi:hypothetical protein
VTNEISPTILRHGTTLRRARAIEANGPDPTFREPGASHLPPAEGFSTTIRDAPPCLTGTPEMAAREKDALFPNEGGPAILEIEVPAEIMAILYADPIAAGLARSGEIRSGKWPQRTPRRMGQAHEAGNPTVTTENPIAALLAAPLGPDWSVERLAEQLLSTIASQPKEDESLTLDMASSTDRQFQRVLRPLLACLATKSAAEAGASPHLYGGQLAFKRPGPDGPVWILADFENKPGSVAVTFRRSPSPPPSSQATTSDPPLFRGTITGSGLVSG